MMFAGELAERGDSEDLPPETQRNDAQPVSRAADFSVFQGGCIQSA